MSEKQPSRFAQFEADSAVAVAKNQEQVRRSQEESTERTRRQEAFLARAEKANDTAELELYGSNGRTFVDPETGDVIADKDRPISGKLDEIRSNRRYGRTEDERAREADLYEQAILNNVNEGMPLAQAKLIVDLDMTDVHKRGEMIGKQLSAGLTYEEASEKVDTLLARLAEKRRQIILDGGALTVSDYEQLRRGVDLYPAPASATEVDEPGDENPEGDVLGPEGDETLDSDTYEENYKLDADGVRAKRALMVQQGLRALDVGNMSDEDVSRYNLVERNPGLDEKEADSLESDNRGELIDARDVDDSNVTISQDNTGRELVLVQPEEQESTKMSLRDRLVRLYDRAALGASTAAGYLMSKFNQLATYKLERREGESDTDFEKREKNRKIAAGLGLGAIALVAGGWAAKELLENASAQGVESASIPGFTYDNEVPPADLVAQHAETPGFTNDNETPPADLVAGGVGGSGEVLNIDRYEYPWNWAVEEFGMGEAMTKLHELGEAAKAAGHNVEWHNVADGNSLNDWISIDGNSESKHVIEILNKFHK